MNTANNDTTASEKRRSPWRKRDILFCILYLIVAVIASVFGRYTRWLALAAVIVLFVVIGNKERYSENAPNPKKHLISYIFAALLLVPAFTMNAPLKLYYPVQKLFFVLGSKFPSSYSLFPDTIPLDAENYDHYFYPPLVQSYGGGFVKFHTDAEHVQKYEQQRTSEEIASCTVEEYLEQYGGILNQFSAEEAAGSTVYIYWVDDGCGHAPHQVMILNEETGFVYMQG